MGKINQKRPVVDRERAAVANHPQLKTNLAGGLGYDFTDQEVRLFTTVACALISEDRYYKSGDSLNQELLGAIQNVITTNPKFVLQLAAFARNRLFLRSVPIVLLGEACKSSGKFLDNLGRNMIVEYVPKIIRRADEILEILAYVSGGTDFGDQSERGMVPNALRKGLAKAFHNFDEYQMLKYDRKGGAFSLRDALRLVHPRPNGIEEDVLWAYFTKGPDELGDKIAKGMPQYHARQLFLKKDKLDEEALKLMEDAHATWEVAISHFGNKKEVWDAILPNMGYMAVLRNLRNMLEVGVDPEMLAARIADPKAISKSKQLPFRFYTALKMVPGGYQVINEALTLAMEMAVQNVPKLPGNTLVAIDFSGSMENPLSNKSSITMKEIGIVMGAIAVKASKGTVVIFGENMAFVNQVTSQNSIMGNINILWSKRNKVGYSTNAHLVLEAITKDGMKFDRIMLISDMQCWDSGSSHGSRWGGGMARSVGEWYNKYKAQVNPDVKLVSIDMVGYGNSTQIPDTDPSGLIVAGWNSTIYDLIDIWENGQDYLDVIRNS